MLSPLISSFPLWKKKGEDYFICINTDNFTNTKIRGLYLFSLIAVFPCWYSIFALIKRPGETFTLLSNQISFPFTVIIIRMTFVSGMNRFFLVRERTRLFRDEMMITSEIIECYFQLQTKFSRWILYKRKNKPHKKYEKRNPILEFWHFSHLSFYQCDCMHLCTVWNRLKPRPRPTLYIISLARARDQVVLSMCIFPSLSISCLFVCR